MLKLTPQKVLNLQAQELDSENGLHMVFNMNRDSKQYLLDNAHLEPTEKAYLAAIQTILEDTEIELSLEQLKNILKLYPESRILLAIDNSVHDTSVRESLSSMMSQFLLSCDWPTYGDKIDINKFTEILHLQAAQCGFKIVIDN